METFLARSAGIRATAGCNWKDFRQPHASASQYGTPCSLSAATVLVWCISCDINLLRRLPGLPNHYVGLETMLGIDEDLDVEDVLSGTSISMTVFALTVLDPSMYEKGVNLHSEMEKQLFGRAL